MEYVSISTAGKQDTITVNLNDLNYCKNPKCQQKLPHNHELSECVEHHFCNFCMPLTEVKAENQCPFPPPLDDYVKSLTQLIQKQYVKSKSKLAIKSPPVLENGKKLLVTEYFLDTWYAEQAGLDINDIPPYRPPHINKHAYENLKKYAAYNQQDNNGQQTKGRERVITKQSAKEIQQKKKQNYQSQIAKSPQSKKPILNSFQPVLFPVTKKIESFIDTLPVFSEEEYLQQQQNSIEHTRSRKKRSIQSQMGSLIIDEAAKPKSVHNKRVQIVKQHNYHQHSVPNKDIQNRLNSSLIDVMSRTEVQLAAERLAQFPKQYFRYRANKNEEAEKYMSHKVSPTKTFDKDQPRRKLGISSIDHSLCKVDDGSKTVKDKTPKIFQNSANNPILTQKIRSSFYKQDTPKIVQNTDLQMLNNKYYGNFDKHKSFFNQRKSKTNVNQSLEIHHAQTPRTKIKQMRERDYKLYGNNQTENLKEMIQNKHKSVNESMVASTRFMTSRRGSNTTVPKETTSPSYFVRSQHESVIRVENFAPDTPSYSIENTSPQKQELARINLSFVNQQSKFHQAGQYSITNQTPSVTPFNGGSKQNDSFAKRSKPIISMDQINNCYTNEESELSTKDIEHCNLIIKQIQPDNRKIKPQVFQDAEYWLGKGYQVQRQESVEVALDYYLHGIRANPYHYACVYNLACVYSQLEKQNNAKKWFNFAVKIQPSTSDSYFGSALSSFKYKNYQEAFDTLKNIPINTQSLFLKPEDFSYFKALCLKKLKLFKECEKEYKALNKAFRLSEGKKLIKYVVSLTILPLQTDRKLIEDYLDNFSELMNLHNQDLNMDKQLQVQLQSLYVKGEWTNPQQAVKVLSKQPFFKRVRLIKLMKYLPQLELIEKKYSDLIFTEDTIVILVNGRVILRQHQESALDHKVVATYTAGQIIGYRDGDEGFTNDSNIWTLAASRVVQYIQCSPEIFDKLWKFSKQKEIQVNLAILQQVDIVKNLYMQTQFALAYEYGQKIRYEAGDVIMTQHQRSVLNDEWYNYYKDRGNNKLQLEIEKQLREPSNSLTRTGLSPTVYEGFMKALSRRKTDVELMKVINDNNSYNPNVKKTLFQKIGTNLINMINTPRKTLSENNTSLMQSPQSHIAMRNKLEPLLVSEDTFDSAIMPTKQMRPIIIILEGKCKVINPSDQYLVTTLKRGDVIGESEFLRLTGYDYFGDIIADEGGVNCIIIENPDQVISLMEKARLAGVMSVKLDGLKHNLETKYKLESMDIHKY